jgi:putative phosphoribosyl transferase
VPRRFRNRAEAGWLLAGVVKARFRRSEAVVMALPRGGVPVGFEVAGVLSAPLDLLVARKLGVPGQTELAMGAIASGGIRVLSAELIAQLRISADLIDEVTLREQHELARQEALYRERRPAISLAGRAVLLSDDGLATGATMLAAARSVRRQGAGSVIVAVPVGAAETCKRLREEVDEVICLATPHPFGTVGAWYEDFSQTSDEEVCKLLDAARGRTGGGIGATAIRTHQKITGTHPTE